MSQPKLPAHEMPGGRLVRHQDRIWLKAWRDSKDYVNHYLVAARASPDLTLVYIDPETELEPVGEALRLDQTKPRPLGEDMQPGDALVLESGRRFIKVLDIKKDGQRHLAYVDIETGEIRPRQERGQAAVFSGWSLIDA
ncbi:hypothetical protein MTBLM1_40013 [Rhodospirillaceae bacterium LM-1]|nr:hypothetical protein MTBLM1_40013 [Rhodospirillaceae bacterium LM-1]